VCVRPSVRFFLKGMPFKLHIYLGAFVTYCDPILVNNVNMWFHPFADMSHCRFCITVIVVNMSNTINVIDLLAIHKKVWRYKLCDLKSAVFTPFRYSTSFK